MATGTEGKAHRTFFRHPAFWGSLSLLAVVAVIFAIRFFPVAFPYVGIDLEMDRAEALTAAQEVAEERAWGPEGFRQAASFSEVDREVRTYLELELEVEDAFRHLVAEADYHPYVWRVRHFQEGEAREVTTRFTPQGALDGFTLRVPEDDPGPALPADSARALAEAEARAMGVELDRYELVESSTETRPSDRVDHTLVYERPDADLGDADARVRLGVAGDELSEVRRLIRVPEAFSREYSERRSANETLALAASLVFLLVFGLVGCGGGIFYLIRRRALVWKPALAFGAVVAGLAALSIINALPLAWMGYDTAVSSTLFLVEQWGAVLAALVVGGALLGVIFMAAEGLTRGARPEEPYAWKLWSPGVADTRAVLGRTVAGYLLAAIQLGFVVAFYFFAMQRPGWWMPSEALLQPDFLAAYLPSLTAIAQSFLAGTWEESLFRAVPIAGAILLARRFGAKGLLVAVAVLVQAAVFAAAHAGYPQQPAYARLVELVLPATAWGVVYLRFGLLPVVLAHFLYNLTWFSLPLFVAPVDLWLDRGLVMVVAFLPLAVVLYRGRGGFRDELPQEARSGSVDERVRAHAERAATAETPHPEAEPVPETPEEPSGEEVPTSGGPAGPGEEGDRAPVAPGGGGRRLGTALLVAGGVGAAAWLAFTPLQPHVPSLEVGAEEAEEAARAELERREADVDLDGPWEAFPRVVASRGGSHRFVWEEGGGAAYRELLDAGHLRGPHWVVRFARFTGSSEERAEEFQVRVGPTGEILRYRHTLPEAREGAELGEEEARDRALGELQAAFGLPRDELEEVSADSDRMPERLDWSFEFRRPAVHPLEEGEARAGARISGDRVTDGRLYVHVPEAWERRQEERSRRGALLGIVSGGALILLLGGAAVRGLVHWARGGGGFRPGALAFAGGVAALATAVQAWNDWPTVAAVFDTARPWRDQVFALVGAQAVLVVVLLGGLGLAAGFAHAHVNRGEREADGPTRRPSGGQVALWGVLLGLVALGGFALLERLLTGGGPHWLSYGGADARLPFLAPGVGTVVRFLAATLVVLVLLGSLRNALGKAPARAGVVAVVAGLVTAGPLAGEGAVAWVVGVLVGGLALLALARLVEPVGPAALPVAAATALGLPILKDGVLGPYPGAAIGAVLALILLAALAGLWARMLLWDPASLQEEGRDGRRSEPEGASRAVAVGEATPVSGRTAEEPGP